jgi:putative inorganic carbon (HCO3(-)) transporter
MIAFAALSGPLPKAGVIVAAVLSALSLIASAPKLRAAAMAGALVLAPALLLADIWSSPQLRVIHRHPLMAAVGAAAALVLIAALAVVIARRPAVLAVLTVAALPFRIPIQAGGTTSNLLVPLYLVVAAGSFAYIVKAVHSSDDENDEWTPGWVPRLLALYVVVYAVQSIYSADFERALQQVVFFYVPFALLFVLLTQLRWTPGLIRVCFTLVVVLAVLFAAIGFVEYSTKTIFLNPKLVVANDLHTYFTVNSVFFDPDIFGRFLALVMIGLAAILLFDRSSDSTARIRQVLGVSVILAVLWGGLVLTLSRSSLGALLVGLATLAALRWRVSRTLWVVVVVVAVGAAAVAISPKTFGLNQGLNGASSGRADLVSGGSNLFADRPVWGYGSGSFVTEYRRQNPGSSQTLSASHTIPITIAAEQGVIGELVYLTLVIVAIVVLLRGSRSHAARAAIAAAFLALVLHTLLYADFLEDPVTWALLAIGVALAARASKPEPDAGAASAATAVAA